MRRNRNLQRPLLFALLIGLAFLQQIASAAQAPAIEGYSPVSYFTKNAAERGSPEFQAEYEGKIYYLSSDEQVALFNENPQKYVPRFGAYCPYSLAHGRRVEIDPASFKIVGGTLLLFHKSEQLDAREEWGKGDEDEQLEAATGEFILFRF